MTNSPEPEVTEGAETFLASKMTSLSRRVDHLTYSLWMISSIPAACHDESDPLSYACMVDAFLVHVRLLAEFLVRRTPNCDFGPNDLVQHWVAPESSAAQRVHQHWELASRHVVHFSHERVPDSLDDLNPIEPDTATLRTMANDVLTVMSEFVVTAEKQKIEHADRLRGEYDEALQRMRQAPRDTVG
jgi:hypothetical protein